MPKGLKLVRIQKTKIYQDIVEQIKTLFLGDAIKEGDRLPTERELAEQFGVSRVTVRQALTVLHEMGLVESRPGGGTFVARGIKDLTAPLTGRLWAEKTLLQEPLEVRRIIEPEATALAASRATSKHLSEMRRILALQESKARSGQPITEEDTLFHEAIAKATGNSILIQLVQSLHQHLRASRHQSLIAPGGNRRSIDDHKKILSAIERKDAKAASRAMINHLRNVERLISQTLEAKAS
jgi:GntR family transcriptional repressor for pyruvate dehydrogenase complex